MKIKILSGLVLSCFLFGSSALAQEEYDDLYFSKKDRIKKERKALENRVLKPSTDIGTENQSISKYANPDFQGGAIMDDSYTPTYNYYDEALARDGRIYNENYMPGMAMGGFNDPFLMNDPFLRNRLMRDPFLRQRMMNDPFFWDRMAMNSPWGFGMNPGFGTGLGLGFGSGWGMGFGTGFGMGFGSGFGMGFGNPWMFDPFMNPWMSPGLGWGMGSGFAMNSFYGNRFGWNPFWGGNRMVVVEREPRTRVAQSGRVANMSPDRLQQLRNIPDSQRKYPSRIRNFDRRSLQQGTNPNGRYSRTSNSYNNTRPSFQRSQRSYQSPRKSSSWNNSNNNNSRYRQSSSPVRRSSTPRVSPSRSTRSIRRN